MGRIFNLDSPVMSFLNKMADLIYLNFLTLICCIPIITIGASLTALNYVTLKMVRNEEGYITRSFFKSFKQNFKQATIIWMIMLLFFFIFVGDLYIFSYAKIAFPSWLKIALIAVGALVLFATIHVFPVLSRFENTVRNTFKNSMLMGILSLPKTVVMIVCWAIPAVVVIFFTQMLPIVFAFGISGPVFLSALLYNGTFKRFEPKEEEENGDDWFIDPSDQEGELQDQEAEVNTIQSGELEKETE